MKKQIVFAALVVTVSVLTARYFTGPAVSVGPVERVQPEQKSTLPPPRSTPVPDTVNDTPVNKTLLSDSTSPSVPQEQADQESQRLATETNGRNGAKPVNLSDYNVSIKSETNKGFEILPGVNVKNKMIQVQLDPDNTRSVEIQRNPPNSNNQYQMMLKKKF